MEANEYIAYTISRMHLTSMFRFIHSGEGLQHHHRNTQQPNLVSLGELSHVYPTATDMHGTPERHLMQSSELRTANEIKAKNVDSSSLSVVISIDRDTCICSTSSKQYFIWMETEAAYGTNFRSHKGRIITNSA